MANIKIYIANEEVTAEPNFEITEELLSTSSVILNKVYPVDWVDIIDNFYFPKDYSNCKIYIDDVLKFNGFVKNSGDITLNPFKPKYATLQILDYKALLSEGKTLDIVLVNTTVTYALQLVLNQMLEYGFYLGNVNITNDTTIEAYSTLDKSTYDILQYFAEITGCVWNTRQSTLDENDIFIDFYDSDVLPQATDIDYTQQYFIDNNIDEITWSYGTKDYRNKQIILSNNVFASIDTTNVLLANGYSKSFIVETPIGIVQSIKIGATSYTFANSNDKENGVYADFYYTAGTNVFESNPENDPLAVNSVITMTYTALISGREIASNESEITRVGSQISKNGSITRYETRNDITNSDELKRIADTYIKFRGIPEIILTVTTRNNDILNIGQQVNFNITEIEELNTNYLVKNKITRVRNLNEDIDIIYTYKLSSNFNAESEINFFDNQRRKFNGNIEKGQYITRNIDLSGSDTIIFENFRISRKV